jgi:hypothetical protein
MKFAAVPHVRQIAEAEVYGQPIEQLAGRLRPEAAFPMSPAATMTAVVLAAGIEPRRPAPGSARRRARAAARQENRKYNRSHQGRDPALCHKEGKSCRGCSSL